MLHTRCIKFISEKYTIPLATPLAIPNNWMVVNWPLRTYVKAKVNKACFVLSTMQSNANDVNLLRLTCAIE